MLYLEGVNMTDEPIPGIVTARIRTNELYLFMKDGHTFSMIDQTKLRLYFGAEKNKAIHLLVMEDGVVIGNVPMETKAIYDDLGRTMSSISNGGEHCRVGVSHLDISTDIINDELITMVSVVEEVFLPNLEFKDGNRSVRDDLLKSHNLLMGERDKVPHLELDLGPVHTEETKLVYNHKTRNVEYIISEYSLA